MNSQSQSQFNSREQQTESGQMQSEARPLEFGSVEEMLRHDALHTPVPPSIGRRLQESLAQLPASARPWWRRLFGGL